MTQNMNPMKAMLLGMVSVFTIILQFFSVGPGYYTMLVELNATAYGASVAGDTIRTQLPIYYDIFYWGYPALTAVGLIYSLAWTILWARKVYFSSNEVAF
jgi:hypothetical protein